MNSPFDAERYNTALKGLGIKIVEKNTLLLDPKLRLEAEYHVAEAKLNVKTVKGADAIEFAQYGTSDALNEDGRGYPVLRLNEFDGCFIGTPKKYCDSLTNVEYEELRLKKGDVLICRTNGNPKLVGRAAIVEEAVPLAFASYLYRVRTNSQTITPEMLVVYLACTFGRNQIDKHSMTSNQTNFSPAKFREIDIPVFGLSFQKHITKLTQQSFVAQKESQSFYTVAETYLLSALGMTNFVPSEENVSIKLLSESFGKTGRLDAGYYQRKYEDIENALNTTHTVKSLCQVHDSTFVPHKSDYKYIELANIGAMGNITGCTAAPFDKLPSRARRLVKAGQVVVSSIEGSLPSCAMITDDYNDAICSTGFYVIDSKKINAETLLVLFKSTPMQALMKRRCSGTILTAISKDALLEMPLPLIGSSAQQQITTDVQRSFALRRESEHLLDSAKRAIEIAIEEGEEVATHWLRTHKKT